MEASTARPLLLSPDLFNQFFDEEWYLHTFPDVRSYGGTPKEHYLAHGYAERRSPHPFFDLNWYFDQHPEVAAAKVEPVSHYLATGWRQLHSPHPMFDPAWYLLENPDILAADIDPLRHYIKLGWTQGRTLHPLFDPAWYLATYSESVSTETEPLRHFLTYGWQEGHCPHPLFDTQWYLDRYTDIKTGGMNPWLHYIQSGWREGRSPNARFDSPWYQRQYLDPIEPRCEPLTHYLTRGWREGLLPSPNAPKGRLAAIRSEAPLLEQMRKEMSLARPSTGLGLRNDGSRGTLVMVVHETEVGGAPHVLHLFAEWVRNHTRFDVRIVAIFGGNLRQAFASVAPLLILTDFPEEQRKQVLKDWLGEDVRGVFLNSIASGKFLHYMPAGLPTVAFIHEMPQVMDLYPTEEALVRAHVQRIICGGPDVTRALNERFSHPEKAIVSAHSFIESLPKDANPAERRVVARDAFGVPEGRVLVMGCGLLHWRKAPDKFIETAEDVLARGIDAEFVWLGGGPDYEACVKLVSEKGLEGRVRFTGYEPAVADKLAAADIFLLSSTEDPFPLVALYAAQSGLPIVCFQKAGGIEGFVARGSGTAVPLMDVAAMADAVSAYALDRQSREAAGDIGRSQVQRSYTIDVVGPMLLHHLREVMGMAPEVSVVLPNYNYEAFLPQRLDSIADQTFQDFEVILLDDASQDNSVDLLGDFADRRPGTRVIINDKNTGSPFAQWMKGMDAAQSDLIWLAEADDRCRAEFLETMLPFFDDRNVRIASCASQPVTAEGVTIGDYRSLYLDRITPGRWDEDYVATDHEEANAGLGIANSIPNASAVMFRKFTPEPEFARELTSMRLCGDWYFYARAMRGGLIGFSAALLNDHRRHGDTVTHKLEGSMRYFTELATVRRYLGRTYRQSTHTKARIAGFLAEDIARFGVADAQNLPQVPEQDKTMPSLLVVAPDLSPGGGQVFAISVANEWSRRGGRALLLNVGNLPTHPAVLAKIAPRVGLLEASVPGNDLGTLISRFDIDVIHSGIWWADRWVDNHRDALPESMPWIITMHGCHETFLADPGIDPSFPDRLGRMIRRARWVYTAEKNLEVFKTYGKPQQLSRIANGMDEEPVKNALRRRDLGLRDEATLLCLASRAIDSKGWNEAVRLSARLNGEGHAVDLLLIGEGPAADKIQREVPPNVRVVGQVSNLQDYLKIADIGLLPSSFVGESLPLVLLEMMATSLPLVASEIGEIPWILGRGDNAAGLLIPLKGKGVDEEALYAAVLRLLDKGTRNQFAQMSRRRYETEFTLGAMVDQYSGLYTQAHDILRTA